MPLLHWHGLQTVIRTCGSESDCSTAAAPPLQPCKSQLKLPWSAAFFFSFSFFSFTSTLINRSCTSTRRSVVSEWIIHRASQKAQWNGRRTVGSAGTEPGPNERGGEQKMRRSGGNREECFHLIQISAPVSFTTVTACSASATRQVRQAWILWIDRVWKMDERRMAALSALCINNWVQSTLGVVADLMCPSSSPAVAKTETFVAENLPSSTFFFFFLQFPISTLRAVGGRIQSCVLNTHGEKGSWLPKLLKVLENQFRSSTDGIRHQCDAAV